MLMSRPKVTMVTLNRYRTRPWSGELHHAKSHNIWIARASFLFNDFIHVLPANPMIPEDQALTGISISQLN